MFRGFFYFKQKTTYEYRISDWSSDVCSSDLTDFGAVGHAVAQTEPDDFVHLCGPKRATPVNGVISIIGPGTGLGVAQLMRDGAAYRVVETEGGHGDFAPLDGFEDGLLAEMRQQTRRVSVERIVSGPGIREDRKSTRLNSSH